MTTSGVAVGSAHAHLFCLCSRGWTRTSVPVSLPIELHGISWGAGLLFTSEGLRAHYLSTAPCHTYRPLSLLPAKASVHNLYRHTQRRLLCQPRLDCTV